MGCALRCLPHCSSSLAPHCSSSLAPTVGPPLPAPHTHHTPRWPRTRRGSISHRNLRESHTPKLRSGRGGAFAAARVAATSPPALHLHIDVLNQVFTCEDDLFGSVALAPYLEGGAESGQLVDVPLMRAEGQLGGVLSCSWRLVRSSELIDLWEPSLMDTTAS